MSQLGLARASGVSRQAIYNIEVGNVRMPHLATLKKLAKALRLPIPDNLLKPPKNPRRRPATHYATSTRDKERRRRSDGW